MATIATALNLLLGVTFLFSALPKLYNPKGFILTVLEYRVLPPYLSKIYGKVLPTLELSIALLALSGIMIRLVSFVMSFLLFNFIIAISVNIKRGRDLNCNCFGTLKKRPIRRALLIQDSILLCGAIFSTILHAWVPIESWSIFHLSGINNRIFALAFVISTGIIIVLRWFFLPNKALFLQKKSWSLASDGNDGSRKGDIDD